MRRLILSIVLLNSRNYGDLKMTGEERSEERTVSAEAERVTEGGTEIGLVEEAFKFCG